MKKPESMTLDELQEAMLRVATEMASRRETVELRENGPPYRPRYDRPDGKKEWLLIDYRGKNPRWYLYRPTADPTGGLARECLPRELPPEVAMDYGLQEGLDAGVEMRRELGGRLGQRKS